MAKKNVFTELIKAENVKTPAITPISITVVAELKAYIPPLTKEEFLLLEQNILAEGCREALILWQNAEQFILVDGHNRYEICQKHQIPYKTITKSFTDIETVKNWMIQNQLGKRNITEEVKSYLRGLQYKSEKIINGGEREGSGRKSNLNDFFSGGQLDHLKNQDQNFSLGQDVQLKKDENISSGQLDHLKNQDEFLSGGQLDHLIKKDENISGGQLDHLKKTEENISGGQLDHLKTHEKLAIQHKVSAKTIQRDEKFYEGLEMISQYDEYNKGLKWKILNREIIVPKTAIISLVDKDESFVKDFIAQIQTPNTNISKTVSVEKNSSEQMHKKEIEKLVNLFFKNKDKATLLLLQDKLADLEKEIM